MDYLRAERGSVCLWAWGEGYVTTTRISGYAIDFVWTYERTAKSYLHSVLLRRASELAKAP